MLSPFATSSFSGAAVATPDPSITKRAVIVEVERCIELAFRMRLSRQVSDLFSNLASLIPLQLVSFLGCQRLQFRYRRINDSELAEGLVERSELPL